MCISACGEGLQNDRSFYKLVSPSLHYALHVQDLFGVLSAEQFHPKLRYLIYDPVHYILLLVYNISI